MKRLLGPILVILFLGFTISGCLDDIEEIDLYGEGTGLPQPSGLTSDSGDGYVHISWTEVSGAAIYRLYRQPDSEEMVLLASVTGTEYLDEDVVNGEEYTYSVSAVSPAGEEGVRSRELTVIPSIYSLIIDNGAGITNINEVILTITAPVTTALMKISNIPDLSGAAWEIYTAARIWNLTDGDGAKTVYATFQDGNGTGSGIISADVTLDSYAAISSVTFTPDPEKFALGAQVHFYIRVDGDETGGEAWIELEGYSEPIVLRDDGVGGDITAGDGSYEQVFNFPISFRGTGLGVAGQFVDRAGNQSLAVESGQKIDFTDLPEDVTLLDPMEITNRRVTLNWSESAEDDFRAYRIYRSTSPGVGEQPEFFIRGLDNRSQTSYPDSDLDENVTYYYRIFVINDLGEGSGSNEIEVTTLDMFPVPVVLDAPSAVGTDRLTLTWSINGDTDFSAYEIRRTTSPGVTEFSELVISISNVEKIWHDDTSLDLTGNTYYYRVFVVDSGGLMSRSNEVSTE
ncbi:MAG: hypothetical protein KAV42_06940 [Candidatus Krumholzibacteria bacterium]|nr:hypothetical protein [Candidatus Krumholzibacteria bacterium]